MLPRHLIKAYLILIFSLFTLFAQSSAVKNLKENALESQLQLMKRNRQSRKEQRLFRTAQNYVNKHRYFDAIPILEKLHKLNPDHIPYYQWLLRSYLGSMEIQHADSLVRKMLQKHPNNVIFQIDHGNVLYKQDRKLEAFSVWNQLINDNPHNLNVYNRIAGAMLQNRLPDEAIKVYKLAVRNNPKAINIYQSISGIYKNRLMYVEAAEFLLKYLEKMPKQESYVFNQILSFNIEPEYRENVYELLKKMAVKYKSKFHINVLRAKLYQRYREYEKAFTIFRQLDDKKKQMRELLQFAKTVERDSSYQIAIEAYRYFVNQFPNFPQIMTAYNGIITTMFSLAQAKDEPDYANRAIHLIDTVRNRFPNHPEIAGLLYLQGIYSLEYFFDVDRASGIFREIINSKRVPQNYRDRALIALGECYVIKGELKSALNHFKNVRQPGQRGKALLQSAYTYYYMKKWDKTEEILEKIIKTEGLKGGATNDALELQMRLKLTKATPDVLNNISAADLLLRQQKKSQALEKLIEISNMSSVPPPIRSQVYSKITTISLDLNEIARALEFSTKAVKDSSIILYADQHLFLMASILDQYLNSPQQAFNIFQQLLEDYPNSLLANQARNRMKALKEQKRVDLP